MDEATCAQLTGLIADMRARVADTGHHMWRAEVQRWAAALAGIQVQAPPVPTACQHTYESLHYWRDVGQALFYCRHCLSIERREVPRP